MSCKRSAGTCARFLSSRTSFQRFAMFGTYTRSLSLAELAAFIRSEQQLWKPVISQMGLTADQVVCRRRRQARWSIAVAQGRRQDRRDAGPRQERRRTALPAMVGSQNVVPDHRGERLERAVVARRCREHDTDQNRECRSGHAFGHDGAVVLRRFFRHGFALCLATTVETSLAPGRPVTRLSSTRGNERAVPTC